jgi:hypothetical protein
LISDPASRSSIVIDDFGITALFSVSVLQADTSVFPAE